MLALGTDPHRGLGLVMGLDCECERLVHHNAIHESWADEHSTRQFRNYEGHLYIYGVLFPIYSPIEHSIRFGSYIL